MNFKDCLERGSITKDLEIKTEVDVALKLAKDFLQESEDIFEIKKYRMVLISAYLSNFHIARALIYSQGYKEHSHICLYVALKELFDDNKQLLVHINTFDSYRRAREKAQYGGEDVSEFDARNIIIDAKDFLKAVEEYFDRPK